MRSKAWLFILALCLLVPLQLRAENEQPLWVIASLVAVDLVPTPMGVSERAVMAVDQVLWGQYGWQLLQIDGKRGQFRDLPLMDTRALIRCAKAPAAGAACQPDELVVYQWGGDVERWTTAVARRLMVERVVGTVVGALREAPMQEGARSVVRVTVDVDSQVRLERQVSDLRAQFPDQEPWVAPWPLLSKDLHRALSGVPWPPFDVSLVARFALSRTELGTRVTVLQDAEHEAEYRYVPLF